jgi:uncharacterized protein (DUF1015 family)
MAEILPIKAWRYSDKLSSKIEELTAPLFDVVSSKKRKLLYENPLNSIHLSVPKGTNPAEGAAQTLRKWKEEQILVQDLLPGIYVYYQYFRLPGEQLERCRKGFICQVKAYDWDEKVIMRHENTIVSAVNDRIELLKTTQFQASPTHGLYEDPDENLEGHMDAAIASPLYELEDYQGVREVLGVIHDAVVITKFLKVIRDKNIILADGHHRLQGAIAYRKSQEGNFPDELWKGHDYHMMYLTNSAGNHLKILPTHRLFYGLELSSEELLAKISKWFTVKQFGDSEDLESYAFHKPWSFGLVIGDESYLIQLSKEKFDSFNQDLPDPIRKLDLEVLHELLFTRILGISTEEQRSSNQLVYERNFSRCIQEVESGRASFAVITRELELAQVLEVCNSGYVMPQKSTYFYPKALGGLLFASIAQSEFQFDYQAYAE